MSLKLWLEPTNEGTLRPIDSEGLQAILAITAREVECTIKSTDIRSPEEHKMFFAIIRQAFNSWKPDHYFQPINEDHLRYWLLCEAGAVSKTFVYMINRPNGSLVKFTTGSSRKLTYDEDAEVTILGNLGELIARLAKIYARDTIPITEADDRVIRVRIAKSVAWRNMGQAKFHWYIQQISDILKAEIDCDIDDLKRIALAA